MTTRAAPMTRYVAFLRAINVAGHATVRMADLRDAFTAAGCHEAKTYIQSGNVIYAVPEKDTVKIHERVAREVRKLVGESAILHRKLDAIGRIVAANPFGDRTADPALKLSVVFLADEPTKKPKLPLALPKERLECIAIKGLEAYIVSQRKPNGFYGFPNAFIEKALGVAATTRNWATVSKIAGLL